MRDNVDEGDQALDSLFGPYDFLDSGLAQLPPESEPSSGRMSESPEDDKIRGQGVLDAFPDPTAGAMLPPEDRFQPVKSEEDRKPGSTDGSEVSSEQAQAPAPKRGRAGAPSGKLTSVVRQASVWPLVAANLNHPPSPCHSCCWPTKLPSR